MLWPRTPTLSKSPCGRQPEALWAPSFWGFWRLYSIGMIAELRGHWWPNQPQPLSPPWRLSTGLILLIGGGVRGGIRLIDVTHYSVTVELEIPYPLFCGECNVYNWISEHLIVKITIVEQTGAIYGLITMCLCGSSSAMLVTAQEVGLKFFVERGTLRLHSERMDTLLKETYLGNGRV